MEISKTKIDRLGDRLRKGNITDDDLRLLDEYRRSFTEAYDSVVGAIRSQLGIDPTGRPAKSPTSITEKLRRESIRLTQVQDIAGCRIVVPDIAEQERVVTDLVGHFAKSTEELRVTIMTLQERIATFQTELGAHREKGIKLFRDTVQFVEENCRRQ